jgi:hypothetical protein
MVPQWYKSRLDGLIQPQADGTFLIRVRGDGGGVRQIDAATRKRWVEFHQSCFWPDVVVAVLILMLMDYNSWISTKIALALLLYAAFIWAEYRGSLAILRHAPAVPPDRWIPVAVSGYERPRSLRLMLMVTMGVLAIVTGWHAIFIYKPSGGFWESREWTPLLFAALFLLSLFQYRAAGRKQPSTSPTLPYRAPTRWRNVIAIAVAPSATGIFWLGLLLLGHGRLTWYVIDVIAWAMVGSYLLSYTFGIPFYLLARRRRWRTAGAYIWGAYLMGAAAITVLALFFEVFPSAGRPPIPLNANTPIFLLGSAALIGLMSSPIGFIFWLITRPDRSE